MTTDYDTIIICTLNAHQIDARLEGEGTDRSLDAAIPAGVADAVVADLTAQGFEASWAPDHDAPGLAWVYIIPDPTERSGS